MNPYRVAAIKCRPYLPYPQMTSCRFFLTLLAEQADENGQVAVDYDWFLAQTGYTSTNSVAYATKALSDLGIITKQRRHAQCVLYTLQLDAMMALVPSEVR
jgi:hypothetical protein